MDNVVEVKGDSDSLIQYVTFQNIVYEHNEWYCPPLPQSCDAQAADYMNTSAIYVLYVFIYIFLSLLLSYFPASPS